MIIKSVTGLYTVLSDNLEYECTARGRFRNENITPVAGDNVTFELNGEKNGVITSVNLRKNEFTRPPLANLDKIFIVTSIKDPIPNTQVIDKIITVCEYKGIIPVLIITKTDLQDASKFYDLYKTANIKVIMTDFVSGENVNLIKNELSNTVSAFIGNTGVGKSTLLNKIAPELMLNTGEISKKLKRGRHTTRHAQLYYISELNCFVADTPGFGSIDISRYEIIKKEELQYCFKEFEPYIENCRFRGCSHTKEKGCAVIEALNEGKISKSRFESYVALYEDAKNIKEWEQN